MSSKWMVLAVALCLGGAAMVRGEPATARGESAAVERREPAANAGPSTLILATGVGLVVIGMTIGVTLFPRRRRA